MAIDIIISTNPHVFAQIAPFIWTFLLMLIILRCLTSGTRRLGPVAREGGGRSEKIKTDGHLRITVIELGCIFSNTLAHHAL